MPFVVLLGVRAVFITVNYDEDGNDAIGNDVAFTVIFDETSIFCIDFGIEVRILTPLPS